MMKDGFIDALNMELWDRAYEGFTTIEQDETKGKLSPLCGEGCGIRTSEFARDKRVKLVEMARNGILNLDDETQEQRPITAILDNVSKLSHEAVAEMNNTCVKCILKNQTEDGWFATPKLCPLQERMVGG